MKQLIARNRTTKPDLTSLGGLRQYLLAVGRSGRLLTHEHWKGGAAPQPTPTPDRTSSAESLRVREIGVPADPNGMNSSPAFQR